MPIDGLFLSHIVNEIKNELLNTRLDKINQPDGNELRLQFKARSGGRKTLVLCCKPGEARMHFTEVPKDNPDMAPMLCMLARKTFAGARLTDVLQPSSERTATLLFSCYNEFGDPCTKKIIFELAGKIPNVLLLGEDNRIIDCLRHVNIDDRPENRPMLPGLMYRPPQLPPDKKPISEVTAQELESLVNSWGASGEALLKRHFYGISPLLCREISTCSGETSLKDCTAAQKQAFAQALLSVLWEPPLPTAVTDTTGKLIAYSFTNILQYGTNQTVVHFTTCSELLDFCYASGSRDVSLKNAAADLSKPVKNALNRLEKKLLAQRSEYANADNRERLRELGDILNAYLFQIPKGAVSVTLPDLYGTEDSTVEIPLDPKLSPQRNAQKYYNDYRKMKSARIHLEKLIAAAELEQEYLNNILYTIVAADAATLKCIHAELASDGIIKQSGQKFRHNEKPLTPKTYTLSNGMQLLCGRTSRQNEQLTFKLAARNDWWFHVKNAPGSHCILRSGGETPTDAAFEEAAAIAAENSSVGNAGHTAVDYTPVRNIKKIPGGKPGMVMYEKYYTLYTK